MTPLPVAIRPRLAQFVRLLASDHDGEVVAAARATVRTLRAAGLSLNELAAEIEHEPAVRVVFRDRPESQPSQWDAARRPFIKAALDAAMRSDALSEWERQFVASILGQMAASRGWHPSPKQQARITALLAKLDLMEVRA